MSEPVTELETRGARWWHWLLPGVVSLLLYWPSLTNWFLQDDFAGLLIAQQTNDWSRVLYWLTHTQAQGVWRPIPDCLFFAGMYKLFGLNALPYKVAIFSVHFLNTLLLNAVARRFTTPTGAMLTALVYVLSPGLIMSLSWTTVSSQVFCAFFFLAGLVLFLRYAETGSWMAYLGQWTCFLLCLATLELSVAYPAVLLVWALLFNRKLLTRIVPMLMVSAGYAVSSLMLPRAASGPYAMHWDLSLFAGLWHYWTLAVGTLGLSRMTGSAGYAAIAVLMFGALCFALARIGRERAPGAVFAVCWMLGCLAPVLPLRDQRMDYYLTLPAAGFGLLVGILYSKFPKMTLAGAVLYAACAVPVVTDGIGFWHDRSLVSQRLIGELLRVRNQHPTEAILLHNVPPAVFYAALFDRGQAVVGLRRIHLWPDSGIPTRPGYTRVALYEFPPQAVRQAMHLGQAVVYKVNGRGELQVIEKPETLPLPPDRLLEWIDIDEPAFEQHLGKGWWLGDPRKAAAALWMSQRAEIRLSAPRESGHRLRIRATFPGVGKAEPVRIAVSANGVRLGTAAVLDATTEDHSFPLPDSVVGASALDVTLEADHTFHIPPDLRGLAAAFGRIEVQ